MVTPHKPDERSVWRRHDRVSPNAAISALELHDGEVCMCWSRSREAERQRANCEEEFLHSKIAPCVTAFCRRSVACGSKDYRNRTRELVTAQIVGWVNVTRRKNQPLQIWTLKKRGGKAALIWPCRRARVFALHSYRLQPRRSCGAFFFAVAAARSPEDGRVHAQRQASHYHAPAREVPVVGCKQTHLVTQSWHGRRPPPSDTTTTFRTMTRRVCARFVCKLLAAV